MKEKTHASGIDPDLVRELAGILRDSGLTEIEVEQGDLKLRLARGGVMVAAPAPSTYAPSYHPPAAPALPSSNRPTGVTPSGSGACPR
jgi:acetyl-CoA carboxylase biotin carboxyl carrier protein